jgi:hypothetical protein
VPAATLSTCSGTPYDDPLGSQRNDFVGNIVALGDIHRKISKMVNEGDTAQYEVMIEGETIYGPRTPFR